MNRVGQMHETTEVKKYALVRANFIPNFNVYLDLGATCNVCIVISDAETLENSRFFFILKYME